MGKSWTAPDGYEPLSGSVHAGHANADGEHWYPSKRRALRAVKHHGMKAEEHRLAMSDIEPGRQYLSEAGDEHITHKAKQHEQACLAEAHARRAERAKAFADGATGDSKSVQKAAPKPPAGYTAVPGTKHGGFRKKTGKGWTYWYPDVKSAKADKTHFTGRAALNDRAADRTYKKGTKAHTSLNDMATEHREYAAGAAAFAEQGKGPKSAPKTKIAPKTKAPAKVKPLPKSAGPLAKMVAKVKGVLSDPEATSKPAKGKTPSAAKAPKGPLAKLVASVRKVTEKPKRARWVPPAPGEVRKRGRPPKEKPPEPVAPKTAKKKTATAAPAAEPSPWVHTQFGNLGDYTVKQLMGFRLKLADSDNVINDADAIMHELTRREALFKRRKAG